MPIVEAETDVGADIASVFDVAQDYDLRLRWDPFLREMRYLAGAREPAVGVRVWVRAWTGLSMEVEYVTLARPKSVAVRMVRGPFFFDTFAGSWRFETLAASATRVVFRYSFRSRPRAASPLLDPLIVRVFRRDIEARLAGLKKFVEERRGG